MNYSNKIIYQIDFINSILKKYNEKPVFDNKHVIIDDLSWEEYLKIIYKKKGLVRFEIICSSHGFQMNIDRANEVLDLNFNDFKENKLVVDFFFMLLFTCTVVVMYCGRNYTKIYFYDDKGNCIKTLKYVTGLYLKIRCKTFIYKKLIIK